MKNLLMYKKYKEINFVDQDDLVQENAVSMEAATLFYNIAAANKRRSYRKFINIGSTPDSVFNPALSTVTQGGEFVNSPILKVFDGISVKEVALEKGDLDSLYDQISGHIKEAGIDNDGVYFPEAWEIAENIVSNNRGDVYTLYKWLPLVESGRLVEYIQEGYSDTMFGVRVKSDIKHSVLFGREVHNKNLPGIPREKWGRL